MTDQWLEHLKKDYVQGFPAFCGYEVGAVDYGKFEAFLTAAPQHLQQDGFVHAGVLATMADHTAGYAAFTTVSENKRILTIEFKINYFKPATGPTVRCLSRVVHTGKSIIVAESDLFSIDGAHAKQVSKALVTLMAVDAQNIRPNIESV